MKIAAYRFAEENGLPHRFNKNKKKAGESWLQGFCLRQNIVLRQPEKCSMGRIMGFNRVQVSRFYNNLQELYEQKKYAPSNIYNMDETGLSTVPNKLPKVLTSKGKKLVGKVTSADRGQLITAVCCVSVTGTYIPPGLIFARKRMKEELFQNAPPDTLGMISDTGFINSELFLLWLKHFKKFSKPSAENRVLLILDNHSSHRDLQTIEYCRANYIDLLSIPPHSSHKMQPLDIGFFAPLKTAFSNFSDHWMISNPGKVITQMHLSGLFNDAYSTTANIQKAQNSFRAAGIYPFNPDIFQDVDFAPSQVTDVPMETQINENDEVNFLREQDYNERAPCVEVDENYPPHCTPPSSPILTPNISDMDIICEDGVVIPVTPGPSKETERELNKSVPVSIILPLPKLSEKPNRSRNRSQKSEVLSSTPFKNLLQETQKTKENKLNKKAENVKKKLPLSKCDASGQKKRQSRKGEDAVCPGCGELYSVSEEDWIKCSECDKWWHESCTTYVMGKFTCFCCQE